jgi:DNA-binding response OmpR family regulator
MRKKTVLLVDDEQPILKSLGNYLERSAFNVTPVISGEDALAEFRSTASFDLVITDLVMAGISGLEVLKEIRKTNHEIGVFILTGYGNMSLAIEALRSGADDFILKPCNADELIFKMEHFFEKQDALRKVKIYEKFLPICMYCKRIRDDSGTKPGKGRWVGIEKYLCQKSGADLTHGCCPECFEEHICEFQKAK